MRRFGMGMLGFVAGLILGFVAQDLLSRALTDDGEFPDSVPLAILVGFTIPLFVAAGVFVALTLDSRRQRRRPPDTR